MIFNKQQKLFNPTDHKWHIAPPKPWMQSIIFLSNCDILILLYNLISEPKKFMIKGFSWSLQQTTSGFILAIMNFTVGFVSFPGIKKYVTSVSGPIMNSSHVFTNSVTTNLRKKIHEFFPVKSA
jgi:hypothetical protein